MASPFLWSVLVPYALRATAPVNLGVERPFSSTATGRFCPIAAYAGVSSNKHRAPQAATRQWNSPGRSSSVGFILLACCPPEAEPVIAIYHKQL